MDTQTAAIVAVPVITITGWLLNLEGRVRVNAALHQALSDDVRYIRERIDTALNGRSEGDRRYYVRHPESEDGDDHRR